MPSTDTVTWNGVTYHAVTAWYKSSDPDGWVSWLYPAVRFLIGEDSTATSAHVIAQYGAYTTADPIPWSYPAANNYLDHCLNNAPTTGSNQAGADWFADNAQDKFFIVNNTVQAAGYPTKPLPITDNIMSYGRPYIVSDFTERVYPGGTVTSKVFYAFLSANYADAKSVQKSYTVESVSLTYDANGGTGSTTGSTRIKGWAGCPFTLTVAQNGFQGPGTCAFVGWSTTQYTTPFSDQASAEEHVDYYPDDVYRGSSNLKLYAVWRYTNKTVSYNINLPAGVTAESYTVPDSRTAQSTESITIGSAPSVTNMRPPHTFVTWNTKADGSGTPNYAPGSSYTAQLSATMYAKWYIDYVRPAFSGVVAQRSNSSGTYQVDGQYLHVSGHVVVNPTTAVSDNQPVSLTISWTDPTGTSTGADVVTSFSNGDFEYISSSTVLDPGKTYVVTLSFEDTFIHTYPSYASPQVMTGLSIGVAFITFSTNARGYSAAFGKQADQTVSGDPSDPDSDVNKGRLDIHMNTYFHGSVNNLPAATTIDNGVVRPDGTSITINDGVISATQQATVTNRGYGDTIETILATAAGSGVSDGWNSLPFKAAGWREWKYSDGRLERWHWHWRGFASGSPGLVRNESEDLTSPSNVPDIVPTPFISLPTISVQPIARALSTSATYADVEVTATVTDLTGTSVRMHYVASSSCRTLFIFKLEGNWQ